MSFPSSPKMEDLLAEMERCLQDLHDWDGQSNTISASVRKFMTGYQSCIRRNGKPILPPLMTDEKRSEMRKYKEAAIQKEKELLMKQKGRVNTEHQESGKDQDIKTNLSLVLEEPHHLLSEEARLLQSRAGSDQATSTTEMFVDASINLPDNSGGRLGPIDSHKGGMFHSFKGGVFDVNLLGARRSELYRDRAVSPPLREADKPGLGESLPSTSSSSDVSGLNQTIIDLSDLQDHSRELKEDERSETESSNCSESGTWVAKMSRSSVREVESEMQMEAGALDARASRSLVERGIVNEAVAVHIREDKNQPGLNEQEEGECEQKYLAATSSLRQSFSDTESFISFVGDYNKLPTPTPSSSTPEVLPDMVEPKPGDDEGETPTHEGRLSSRKGVMDDEDTSLVGHQCSPEVFHHMSGGLSTMDTNISSLGSLGQSCTLPISVTASCDSTLADISERLDTPSVMEELPRDKPEYHGQAKDYSPIDAQEIENKSGSGTDSSLPSTIRKGPVGQEAEGSCQGSSGPENTVTDGDKIEHPWLTENKGTGRRESSQLSSPVRRVRKNSYTLEIPSPALLDAKARNEAPYAESLDVGEEIQRDESFSGGMHDTGESILSDVPVDEIALVSQLELLEEIKRRLAMEQEQQLQELLERQKKEKWLLQQEMSDVQRKVIASRAGSEQSTERRWTPDDQRASLTGATIRADKDQNPEQPRTSNDHRLLQQENSDMQERAIPSRTGNKQESWQQWTSNRTNSATMDNRWPSGDQGLGNRWSPGDLHNFSTGGQRGPSKTSVAVQDAGLGRDSNLLSSETTSVHDSLEQVPYISRGHSTDTMGHMQGPKMEPPVPPTPQPGTDGWSHTMAVLSRQRTPVKAEYRESPQSPYFSENLRVMNQLPDDPGGMSGFYLEDGSEGERDTRHGHGSDVTEISAELDTKYDRISAAAKGFLTRRVMAITRVQEIVKTIKDSNVFILKMQTETPIRGGNISAQDAALAQRIFNQLRAARFELHDIFHSLSPASRMGILRQDREAAKQQLILRKSKTDEVPSRPLSAATLKALERKKKAKEAEGKKSLADKTRVLRTETLRPKSAPNSRILKPLQNPEAPSFPTRPVSSAAYRSHRTNQNHKPVRITVASRGINRAESEIKTTNNRPKQNVPTTAVHTKPQSNVRRVLYPAPSSSTKKITRKQASKKPFKP